MPDPSGSNPTYTYNVPLGKALKANFPSGGILTQARLDAFANNNIIELIDLFLPTSQEFTAGTGQSAIFKIQALAALKQYVGKDLSTVPDNIPVTVDFQILPWKPFETIIPGIPNIGIDPSTGQFSLPAVLGSVGGFFAYILSINWLMVIVAGIGLFLLWKAYQGMAAPEPV